MISPYSSIVNKFIQGKKLSSFINQFNTIKVLIRHHSESGDIIVDKTLGIPFHFDEIVECLALFFEAVVPQDYNEATDKLFELADADDYNAVFTHVNQLLTKMDLVEGYPENRCRELYLGIDSMMVFFVGLEAIHQLNNLNAFSSN